MHAESSRSDSDLTSDPSQADDADGSPFQLRAEQRRSIPSAGMHRAICPWYMPQERDHCSKKKLDYRIRVSRWRVYDCDAQGRGGIERDVIDADTRTPNDP